MLLVGTCFGVSLIVCCLFVVVCWLWVVVVCQFVIVSLFVA